MEEWFSDAERAGVVMYLMLFALIVFGGVAVFVGYRVLGIVVACGAVALLVALMSGIPP